MTPLRALALAVPVTLAGAAAVAIASYRSAMAEAETAARAIAARAQAPAARFDPAMVAGLPEVARRYFGHAIAPGTPLRTTVRLEMRGTFLLGEGDDFQSYAMTARQILRPPHEFVWIPEMRGPAMRISGSDALAAGTAWTRFWLFGLVPVANARTSPDLVRSAAFRAAMEGIWAPAAFLPENGVVWEQIGPDKARILLRRIDPEIALELTLAPDGAVREIVGQRWSDANRDHVFRLQPFGATIAGEASFDGFTVPTRLKAGNHFGTSDYLPFFQVEVTRAAYL